jgi:type IV secretory pathway VirD2 relaxase
MSRDDDNSFRVRPGRARARDGKTARRPLSFMQEVKRAVAKQGGDPRRLFRQGRRSWSGSGGEGREGGGRTCRSGRFNARGRGAKVAAMLPRENQWTVERGVRFRARRAVVKARVVKLRGRASRAADAHLRYLQRDGVTQDGEPGQVYSAIQDRANGEAFVKRSREDRHQFRFIVAPEDGAQLGSLRTFTRGLMDQMEQDLGTRLDWVAVDHHNTGHPHTHIVVRGVTEDGKILNIAGDYIAHGIRARASEIVTRELGPQTEQEVQQKLRLEVVEDRFTRLDAALLKEVNDEGLIDLRPGAEQSYLGRANRYLLIDRLKKLERLDLAQEIEPGRWSLSSAMEQTLDRLDERQQIVNTIHRVLERRGVVRGVELYVIHRDEVTSPIVGRVLGKGLVEELGDEKYLIVDGIDGRAHYLEIADPSQLDGVRRGGIIEVAPPLTEPHAADRTIAERARDSGGVYRPSEHLIEARRMVRVPHDDYEGYVEAHVRRLEALRRAGIAERIDADHWIIPDDFERRAADYDAQRRRTLSVRVLSAFDLEAQVSSDGATWLDRQILGQDQSDPVESGFGREVIDAKRQRVQVLIAQGFAERDSETRLLVRRDLLATLEQREVARVGQELAEKRNTPFRPARDGEHVYGTFKETVQLVSGKYALIENSHEFTLVPWRPVIDRQLGKEVAGLVRGNDISWEFGRKRSLGISM